MPPSRSATSTRPPEATPRPAGAKPAVSTHGSSILVGSVAVAWTTQMRPPAGPVVRAIAIGAFVAPAARIGFDPKPAAPTGVKLGVRYAVTVWSLAATILLPLATIARGWEGSGIALT